MDHANSAINSKVSPGLPTKNPRYDDSQRGAATFAPVQVSSDPTSYDGKICTVIVCCRRGLARSGDLLISLIHAVDDLSDLPSDTDIRLAIPEPNAQMGRADEFDSGAFECLTNFFNRVEVGFDAALRPFEPANRGESQSRTFGKLLLFPPEQRARRFDLPGINQHDLLDVLQESRFRLALHKSLLQ